MTLDGYTLTELEDLWSATFDGWTDLLARSTALEDQVAAVPWHGARWHELAAQIDVVIAAIRERRALCEAIRAEIDRRPVDA